eukprot:c12706_g1_i1.p1 GENE.c12706_g1_i1~~c12706_g1_i1.p1  ORF type:complete len:214 (+),score=70.82 c12706_g1_i1:23-664(+)
MFSSFPFFVVFIISITTLTCFQFQSCSVDYNSVKSLYPNITFSPTGDYTVTFVDKTNTYVQNATKTIRISSSTRKIGAFILAALDSNGQPQGQFIGSNFQVCGSSSNVAQSTADFEQTNLIDIDWKPPATTTGTLALRSLIYLNSSGTETIYNTSIVYVKPQPAASESSGLSTMSIGGIVIGIVLFFALAAAFMFDWKKKETGRSRIVPDVTK